MSLHSSTIFTTEDLNISHSGVFGRESRRMKERTLSSTEISSQQDRIQLFKLQRCIQRQQRSHSTYSTVKVLLEEIEDGGVMILFLFSHVTHLLTHSSSFPLLHCSLRTPST